MFHKFANLVGANRQRIFSLLMLPAFFLGTLPHTACICADGHREVSCKAAACRAIADGSKAPRCCGCSCCKDSGSQQIRSCCQHKNHLSSKAPAAPVNGVMAKTGSGCQPIVEAPAPATV